MPAATATRSSPRRNAQRAIRSGWAIGASISGRRRRAGVGWPVIVIVRRSGSAATGSGRERRGPALEAARLAMRGVLGRTQLLDGPALGVEQLGSARAPLGGLDLALPLEEHRLTAHVVLIILAQNACTGLLHQLSLVSPAGLADGLALKELRYTHLRDSPPA